jgi:4-amino-4-deoxy-L-arabinose transferase-like glycosyltransferase
MVAEHGWWPRLSRERRWLIAAIVLGLVVRFVYVLLTRHLPLRADQVEYDYEGHMIAEGHWWWSKAPYGIPHPSANKAPLYPLWLGFWYSLFGHHPLLVRFLQVPIGAVVIWLSWLLARRLFGPRVAIAAAFLVAMYPLAWQYEELLYSESLATPLTLAFLVLTLTGRPSRRRAALAGVVLGVALLVRPTSIIVVAPLAVSLVLRVGWRRALALSALAVGVAVVVVAPWTIRNAFVEHGFLPISLEDEAAYGTFNPVSANDPVFPYAWRPYPSSIAAIANPRLHLSDLKLRARLDQYAIDYVKQHPSSLVKAFFWNGLSRLWDVRRPSRELAEVNAEGRSRPVSIAGLCFYYVLFPLALIGLWRWRRRRELLWPVLALALAASVVFTIDAGTRYRAPLEPLIAVLACSAVLVPRGAVAQEPEQPTVAAVGR